MTASSRLHSLSMSASCFSISALRCTRVCQECSRSLRFASRAGIPVSGRSVIPRGRSRSRTACLRSPDSARRVSRLVCTAARACPVLSSACAAAVSSFSPSVSCLRAKVSAVSRVLMAASWSSARRISSPRAVIFCSMASGTGTLPAANGCSVAPQSGQGAPSASLARCSSSSAILARKAISRSRVSCSVRYSRSSRPSSTRPSSSLPCCSLAAASANACARTVPCFRQVSSARVACVRAVCRWLCSASLRVMSRCVASRPASCSSIPARPPISQASRLCSFRYSSIERKVFSASDRSSDFFLLTCCSVAMAAAWLRTPASPARTIFACSTRC